MRNVPATLHYFVLCLACVISFPGHAQSTQTIRGRIIDEVTQMPLVGVSVTISEGGKIIGATSDENGNFRIERVSVGRHTIQVTYIGYEEQTIPNVVVTAGKEVILNISLVEMVSQLQEVEVTADIKDDKTATNNDLAVVSARSFNVDDTKRYAGALGDPSRMAANFAGVIGGNDSRNDIVVRGNAPTGMLWQLEGLNIPNPNHFGSLVATGGPVSILNNNNLDKSDFITSAFPAQYGNANAGVFDLRLRDGNNQKSEFTGQVGFNGFELGAEGPFSRKSEASYLINYRYSTLAVFQKLGIEFGTGSNTPLYQDVNFKVAMPVSSTTKISMFGLGGLSEIDLLGSKADVEGNNNLYGGENEDSYPRYKTAIAGISVESNVSPNTFAKVTAGLSATREVWHGDSLVRDNDNKVTARYRFGEADFNTRKYSIVFYTRTKIDRRNSIASGFTIDAMDFGLYNRDIFANVGRDTVRLDADEAATLYQGHSAWKHRFTDQFSFQAGMHAQYYTLNEQFVAEPRLSIQYVINGRHSLAVGYGLHNQVQNITTSFMQTKAEDGTMYQTNRDLGYTTSHHYVVTYDWNISDRLRIKMETYYQQLRNAPVERSPSSFSALNTGVSFAPAEEDSLINDGNGRNYGLELTMERFYGQGYYFLLTGSLFNSRYAGSDGIERNTAFNTKHVVNTLAGKEWRLGKSGKFFSMNLKLTTIGGKYLTPIDFPRSQQYQRTIYRNDLAYSQRADAYFRADVKMSYRKEYTKSTLEISLDLQNVTNRKNVFIQTYNARTNSVVTQYQQSFFPVPFVRLTF